MDDALACVLEGCFVCIPKSSSEYPDSAGVWIYDPESEVFTEDSRPCPSFATVFVHVVMDDTLHVFSPEYNSRDRHWVYSLRDGWREQDPVPGAVQKISYAQAYGPLLVLVCDTGFYLYDTVSGDWSRVGDPLDVHGLYFRRVMGVPVSPNQMLCVEEHRIAHLNFRDHGILHSTIVTLNPGLLYPSVDMGWGRLLDWDKDRRATLGIERE
ncbi:hypothetical protein KIPB_008012 [Kipferlia bialata]|uniref:Uncharacterized protein n=1 Tax=Kipferlia bialata TaxID=797122 RepID=A0A391NMT7_9EUKA|nr:hypothetical protein KIPB_008012 [Kipferlia bialata]|eukprot:g8012.t1